MHREYHRWYSPSLGRDMELLIIGHAGARLLAFPTSMGRYYEWEDRGMFNVLGDMIEAGHLQAYCVDSVDKESWYARRKHPGARAWRNIQYDNYLTNEVLPLSRQKNGNPFMITAGASFGAYHALNYALRHPDLVGRAIGMSGIYDITRWTDGYYDENIYFNNPIDYISGEQDWRRLQLLRGQDIILAVGRDDGLLESSQRLSTALWNKGIGNALRLWDGWSHDWPYWYKMIRLYIGGHD
ncbi:MAG: esterase [Anaerolineae bacterium]|nr:MAG: esterase [Anaerolineae bacterium]